MKPQKMALIVLFLLFLIGNASAAWAQRFAPANDGLPAGTQPVQVVVIPPLMTDFERYASSADVPVVTLTFPAITAELDNHTSFKLTPIGLAPFDAPGALKVLGAEFRLSQSPPSARNSVGSPLHSVSTLLDFQELRAFRSLLNALAVTGMPRPPFSEARPVVRMVSKSGMRLEFTPQAGGRIQCVATTELDSVTLFLDAETAAKWTAAFSEAWQTLDSAKDSR